MKIKIALDENIGRRRAEKLSKMGYEIVCFAGQAETDESWMARANEEGAQFAISADLDIPRVIERFGYPMFWVWFEHTPNGETNLVDHIDKSIKLKMDQMKKMFGEKNEKNSDLSRFFQSISRWAQRGTREVPPRV